MYWELIPPDKMEQSQSNYFLANCSKEPCILIQTNHRYLVVVGPGGKALKSDKFPAIIFSPEELTRQDSWNRILQYHEIHELDLAVYAKNHPEISIDTFIGAKNQKITYKTRENWIEMAEFDENSRQLGKVYGFKNSVLRLFNRFTKDDQLEWIDIWQRRNIKKNFIRDLITDYYDLPVNIRPGIMAQVREFEKGWGDSASVFPSSGLRDLVHEARYPEISKIKKQIQNLKKQMKLPKEILLELPDDYELQKLELRLCFQSTKELKDQLNILQNSNTQKSLKQLLAFL